MKKPREKLNHWNEFKYAKKYGRNTDRNIPMYPNISQTNKEPREIEKHRGKKLNKICMTFDL